MDPFDKFISKKLKGSFYQTAVLVLFSIVNLVYGCFIIVTNNLLSGIKTIYELSDTQMRLLNTIGALGLVFGNMISGELARRFGASKVIKSSLLLLVFTSFFARYCNDFISISVFYCFVGFSSGLNNILLWTYVMEIVSLEFRGRWLVIMSTATSIGKILCIYFLSLFDISPGKDTWQSPLKIISLVVLVLSVITSVFLRESLRHLIVDQKFKEFQNLFNFIQKLNIWIHKIPEDEYTFVELTEAKTLGEKMNSNAQSQRKMGTFKATFSPEYLKMTIILIFMHILMIFTFNGQNTILSFLFKDLYPGKETVLMIIAVSSEFVAIFVLYYYIDRVGYGRRFTLQASILFAAIVFALSFFARNFILMTLLFFLSHLALKAILVLKFTFTGELYPTWLRNSSLSIILAIGGGVASALPFILFPLYDWFKYSIFIFFFFNTFISFLLSTKLCNDKTRMSLDINENKPVYEEDSPGTKILA
jgi:putative MFS transporter